MLQETRRANNRAMKQFFRDCNLMNEWLNVVRNAKIMQKEWQHKNINTTLNMTHYPRFALFLFIFFSLCSDFLNPFTLMLLTATYYVIIKENKDKRNFRSHSSRAYIILKWILFKKIIFALPLWKNNLLIYCFFFLFLLLYIHYSHDFSQ